MKKTTLGLLVLAASSFATVAFAGNTVPPVTVPEPGSFALLAAGLAGVVAVRLRKRK